MKVPQTKEGRVEAPPQKYEPPVLPRRCGLPAPYRCPMPDGGTCADEKVLQLLGHLIQELEDGRVAQWRCDLVGGLEHDFYFSIYWEYHHPN